MDHRELLLALIVIVLLLVCLLVPTPAAAEPAAVAAAVNWAAVETPYRGMPFDGGVAANRTPRPTAVAP